MKKMLMIGVLALVTSLSLQAQGKSGKGSQHSNAPANTPAASADRDKGTERAEDVGKGKKKGLKKAKHSNKAQKSQK